MPVCRSSDNSQANSEEHAYSGSNTSNETVEVKYLRQSCSSIVVATVIADMQEPYNSCSSALVYDSVAYLQAAIALYSTPLISALSVDYALVAPSISQQ